MKITPCENGFGAEIDGIDLRSPLDAAQVAGLKAAWDRHVVLVFRDQPLTPAEHVRFGAVFGDLWPHPLTPPVMPEHPEIYVLANVLEDKPDHRPPQADFWHTDLTYTQRASRAGILLAREVPPSGGDTLFANMQRAFATLPRDLQRKLISLEAEHGMEGFAARYARATGQQPPRRAPGEGKAGTSVVHPAVIRHPGTGAPSLFVNLGFTIRFLGMSETESSALLDHLMDHATRPDNLYRHKWKANDIVMWDNFRTMHMATGGYAPPMRRIMHRLTVGGPQVEVAQAS